MSDPLKFDPVLLSQARLGVISVLVSRKDASFTDLKELLGLTQGNLTVHLQKLQDEGYVTITKAFVNRKPRTTVVITEAGRRAFLQHLDQLQSIAGGDGGNGGDGRNREGKASEGSGRKA